jgi:hypothetical protein
MIRFQRFHGQRSPDSRYHRTWGDPMSHPGRHDHDHEHLAAMDTATNNPAHPHNPPLQDVQLRVRAPESFLTAKGLVDPAVLNEPIDTYETKVGSRP